MWAELEGYILEWFVSLAEPVVVGVKEITIKGKKTRLSAVKALERICYYVVFFIIIISWGGSMSAECLHAFGCLIAQSELIEEVWVPCC